MPRGIPRSGNRKAHRALLAEADKAINTVRGGSPQGPTAAGRKGKPNGGQKGMTVIPPTKGEVLPPSTKGEVASIHVSCRFNLNADGCTINFIE